MYISQIDKTERLNTLRVILTFRERSTSFLQGRTEGRIMFYLHKKKERIRNVRNFLQCKDKFDTTIFCGHSGIPSRKHD